MKNWKVGALWHLVMYAFDMVIAILGWTYGFGLQVKNWWALIGLLIFSRFVFHIYSQATYRWYAKNGELT
jgi:hypothetical protein